MTRQKKTGRANKSRVQQRSEKVTIRFARATDLKAINDIYNYYVSHSTCTYQEEPELISERKRWFAHHGKKHPVIVAEISGAVVGWGSLSPYHLRSAYRRTVENSVYVHHEHHRRGIGSGLLSELIRLAKAAGHRAIVAIIDADQSGSISLHSNAGFELAGRLKQVGFKFKRWLDVVYMELLL